MLLEIKECQTASFHNHLIFILNVFTTNISGNEAFLKNGKEKSSALKKLWQIKQG